MFKFLVGPIHQFANAQAFIFLRSTRGIVFRVQWCKWWYFAIHRSTEPKTTAYHIHCLDQLDGSSEILTKSLSEDQLLTYKM